MLLLGMITKTSNHTSKTVLFGSLRQGKMRTSVEYVPELGRKVDKEKLDFLFATKKLDNSFTSFATPHLQLEIHPPWQLTVFYTSRNNGNGIIETGYFQVI
jgi:hypothetical protein